MDINDLMMQPNVTISVTNEQLNDLVNQILNGARAIYEKKEQPETYLSRQQAAEMLDVDISSLWRWAQQDYLQPVKVGTKVRYRLSDVERILKGKTS